MTIKTFGQLLADKMFSAFGRANGVELHVSRDNLATALDGAYEAGLNERSRAAAETTLNALGYTYCGGEQWKPPLGPAVLSPAVKTEAAEDLRRAFEALSVDSYQFKRSSRGTYRNPAVARDWKWFQAGFRACEES